MKTAIIVILILILCAAALFALFIFLISGRRRKETPAFFSGLFAHRGLYSNATPDAPENSVEAFRRAVDAGFGIELDVHISADGELFVMHDDSVARMCGESNKNGKITGMTSEEIGELRLLGGDERVPRFSDVLALVDGKVPLIIELKCEAKVDPEPLCRAVYGLLSSYRGDFCVESFNPNVVSWFRKNAPDVFRGQLSEAFFSRDARKNDRAVMFALENLLTNVVSRPDFVAYNCLHIDAFAARAWRHILHMPTALWTVRDPNMAKALPPRECDVVIFEGFDPKSI